MRKSLFLYLALFTALISNAQSYNFEQGVKAYNDKDLDKALDYFGREIKDNPKSTMSFYYRAVIYSYQDQNAAALSDINNTIKYCSAKDKDVLTGAHVIRGDIYLKIENYNKALENYAIALKLSPDDPEIYCDRAQIYFDLKEFDKSESDYRKALKIDESYVVAWAGLGRNYLTLKNYGEAEKILNQLIKLSPEYSEGYRFRAEVYYEQKKYEEAIDDMFELFLLDESNTRNLNLFIAYSEKNYPLAFSKVNAQISSSPKKYIWYYVRAQLYEGKNNFNAAITDYTKVMELSDIGFRANLLSYRGKCYSNLGMYELSIADFSEAISIDSSNAYLYGRMGDAKRLLGDYLGSIKDFTKAVELEPRESWFYYRRGWTKEFVKDFEGALADYNESISIDKKYVYTYLNRGRLYESQLKNPSKAKEDYLSILSLDTIVSEQGNCRQYALFHLGRNDEAIAWLNQILSQYPIDGNYYDATCLYSLMNKPDEAIASLKIAFQKGYRDFVHLSIDDDVDNIRNLPEFKSLVQEWKNTFEESLKVTTEEKPTELKKSSETVSIQMKSKGSGVYEIPCKINDLGLNLIFDTGASDISISQTEVQFMLKNGYLNSEDILGTQKYMDANGDVEIGTKVLFRKVDFGGLILKNINASVVHNKDAPLLFGQSALSKYGKIIIDNEKKIITITTKEIK